MFFLISPFFSHVSPGYLRVTATGQNETGIPASSDIVTKSVGMPRENKKNF